MFVPAKDSKDALFVLKNTTGIDGNWKKAWSDADLASMDLLEDDDLVECLVTLTLMGNESLARGLMERRGPVAIDLKKAPGNAEFDYLVNGQPFKLDKFKILRYPMGADDINSLLSMIVEYDMKGFIDPGESFPALLAHLQTSVTQDKYQAGSFQGDLPELIGGVLRHPELPFLMRHRSLTAAAPAAYQPVLCWASEQMINQFPDQLIPLRVFQEVRGHGSLKQWKAEAGEPGNMEFDRIEMGIEVLDNAVMANLLIGPMAPESTHFGFGDFKGRQLCETNTNFLLSFEAKALDEKNFRAAASFVTKDYCPIRVMAKQAEEICVRDHSYKPPFDAKAQLFITSMHRDFNALFEMLSVKCVFHERALGLLTEDQWRGLVKKAPATSFSVESALALWDTFKIDNTDLALTLHPEDVITLARNGYRFADQTQVFRSERSFDSYMARSETPKAPAIWLCDSLNAYEIDKFKDSDVIDLYRDALKANLWPSDSKRPSDLAMALKMSVSVDLEVPEYDRSMILRAYLLNAGLDACAQVAGSPAQWVKLTMVFSPEELKPYLAIMPKAAKGRVLENVLGM